MRPQTQMLLDCIEIARQDKLNAQVPPEAISFTAFTQLLDWIAVKLDYEVQVVTPPFQQGTHDALAAMFNVELLRGDIWDWFGESAIELKIDTQLSGTDMNRSEAALWTKSFADGMAKHLSGIENNPLLDPGCGTGRMILAHSTWKDQVIIYGVESNKISYRMALLNAFIYGFNSFILNADPDRHELGINSQNWLSANQWHPIAFDELLEK